MILKILKHPLFLVFLIGLAYVVIILDTLKYPGFVANHFFIDSYIYFAVAITLLVSSTSKSKLLDLFFKLNFIFFVVISIAYLVLSYIEATHFSNFIFSTYHINLNGLAYIPLFALTIFLVNIIRIKRPIKLDNLGHTVLVFFIVYTLAANIGASLEKSFEGNFFAFTHIDASYDQKMYYQWHDFYYFMVFVKNNTPPDANIVIPPQIAPWWSRTGDRYLVNAFLYPRKIIQYPTEAISDIESLPQNTYLLESWGEWECDQGYCKEWPTQVIKVKEAIFKTTDSIEVKEIEKDTIYDPKKVKYPFGLLKL